MVTTTKVAHSTHSVCRHHSIANVQDEVMKHYRSYLRLKPKDVCSVTLVQKILEADWQSDLSPNTT